MRIAICDDEQRELSHLQVLAKKYDSNLEVSLFKSAESLLEGMRKQPCDLILLDIEMDGMNGFTAAKKLVDIQNPPLVVFVTNSGEYTYRGYEVAFRYIPKPVTFDVFSEVMSAAIAKIAPQKFTISVDGHSHVIPISDILYFEVFGHSLVVHTKPCDFECRMKLSEVEEALPGSVFSKSHKSYLVNLDYVNTVGEKELSLTSGVKIPISRRRKQEFEQALFRFVRRQP